MLLIGLHKVVLDAKGRIAIPALYRPLLDEHCQGKMVITVQHHGKSLMLYPESEFEEVKENPFKIGEKVLLKSGPFEGFNGEICAIDKDCIKVDVLIFGRYTRVDMELNNIELLRVG